MATVTIQPPHIDSLPSTSVLGTDAQQKSFHPQRLDEATNRMPILPSQQNSSIHIHSLSETTRTIVHYDLVFEFKDSPNERFIFPKEAIIERMSFGIASFEVIKILLVMNT